MNDFFNQNFWQNIIGGLFVLLLSILLGSRAKSSTSSGKGWKIIIIFSYLMIFGGLFIFISNVNNGGFNNVYTGLGLSLFILGIIFKYIGRFFVWWHR